MSTSGWKQGVRKRDSPGEENKADPTPGRFSEGLPTPPKELTAMGWKLVSDGNVKAQLSPELILSRSFCFPSRPCGDTSRSLSEVETSLPQQHPQVFAPPFLSPGAAPQAALFSPSKSLLSRPNAEERQDPVLAKGRPARCGSCGWAGVWSWRRLCNLLSRAGIRKMLPSLSQDMLQPLLLYVLHPAVSAVCNLLAGEGVLCRQLLLVEL